MAENKKYEKLTIERYKDPKRDDSLGEPFVVMFNPITFDRKIALEYEENKEHGAGQRPPKFSKIGEEVFDCEFTLDGTGVTGPEIKPVDVMAEVEKFLDVCVRIVPDTHKPPYLIIGWGKFIFECVLESADISYTLFKKDGTPIRAKITASFKRSPDQELIVKKEKKNSPDLSHLKTSLEGDKIALMTNQVYGKNTSLYFEVAKFNRLNNFRKIKAGTNLIFPPLDKSTN
ncbi:MAG: LysM peptidoglycan-binding domain-containing protein [Bacteroidetes bacterium]|nr:LysM peptidoglycan-binding domain-containing protein [Bacteroidota bacterium]